MRAAVAVARAGRGVLLGVPRAVPRGWRVRGFLRGSG